MKKRLVFLCLFLTLNLCVTTVNAAEFPDKPINVLCVFGPGGAADLGARVIAEYAGKNGIAMNVVNKPTGSGTAAAMDTLKARHDGYTVLFCAVGLITLTQMKNVGFTLEKDFTSVANMSDMPMTFCVLKSSGITSFKEWVEKAKVEPGKYNYASPGAITSQYLLMNTLSKEKFPEATIPHVPYESGHEVNTALLGGHIQAAFGVPGTHKNYLESGDFTLLAVSTAKRLPEYPDVPTLAELYGDKYVWESFHGYFVPKDTPKPVINKLSAVVQAALADPEVKAKFDKIGLTVNYRNPEEADKEVRRMGAFIQDAVKNLQQ